MENYIVSARKYRPSTFESVVGQHALTTTLKNAIATNKLAHAYLSAVRAALENHLCTHLCKNHQLHEPYGRRRSMQPM